MGREGTVRSTGSVHRGNGDGTLERYLGQRGRPGMVGGSVPKRRMSRRPGRESERVIVPSKPGNSPQGTRPREGGCQDIGPAGGKDHGNTESQ